MRLSFLWHKLHESSITLTNSPSPNFEQLNNSSHAKFSWQNSFFWQKDNTFQSLCSKCGRCSRDLLILFCVSTKRVQRNPSESKSQFAWTRVWFCQHVLTFLIIIGASFTLRYVIVLYGPALYSETQWDPRIMLECFFFFLPINISFVHYSPTNK